jgi:hypothetical protein
MNDFLVIAATFLGGVVAAMLALRVSALWTLWTAAGYSERAKERLDAIDAHWQEFAALYEGMKDWRTATEVHLAAHGMSWEDYKRIRLKEEVH